MPPTWVYKLSTDLRLEAYAQDWGICNSDASRLGEFLDYFAANVPDHPWEPEALAELILASADDGMNAGTLTDAERRRVIELVRDRADEFPLQYQYWSHLNQDQFPVAALVANAVGHPSSHEKISP